MYHLLSHFRVVSALLIREMASRFGNKPGGYLWAVLDPVAHIAFLTVIFMAIARAPALGTSFPLFFATGYIAFQFYSETVGFLNKATSANKALLSYPNVAPIDTIVARYILQLWTTTLVGVVVLFVIIVTARTAPTLYWPAIFEAAFMASLLGLGWALFNNVMFAQYPIYEKLFGIVNRPLFLMSGIFFLPDALPHPYREIVLINPLVHIIMLFRQGFYPEYRATGLSTDYVYIYCLSILFMGMIVFTVSPSILRRR